MLPAARIADMTVCPLLNPGPVPHVGGPIAKGSQSTLIGFMPAATLGDMATCTGPPATLVKGSASVLIDNKPAVRLSDTTSHGGSVVQGCPTVLIGDAAAPGLASASASGAPFSDIG